MEHANRHSGFAIHAEILTAHAGFGRIDVLFTETALKNAPQPRGQLFVVEHRGCTFGKKDLRLRRPGPDGDGFGFADDGVVDVLADGVTIAANRKLQMAFVTDDVVLRATVDRAYGNHGRL